MSSLAHRDLFNTKLAAPRGNQIEHLRQNETIDDMPPNFDFLEGELGDGDGIAGNRFTLADLAVGAQLQNWALAQEEIDAARWPKLRAYSDRVLSRPSFKTVAEQVSG